MRPSALLALIALFAFVANIGAQDALPDTDSADSFEIEPPMLIPNRGDNDPLPAAPSEAASPAPLDLQRLEKNLERAKRSAGGAERLYKIGVLARVEVEARILRMIRLESEVENARLAAAKEEYSLLEQKLAAGAISKEDIKQAENNLSHAITAARTASTKRNKAEIEVAEANVKRQRQLLSLGSGRKAEVAKAEQKLAELKAQKPQ